MTVEAPAVAQRLFTRLCRGTNRLLSQNGPDDDADLYRQVEEPNVEAACRMFFAVLGFRLQKGDGCYYFTADDQPQANVESKLEKMIRLVRLLDFLSTYIEHFGEGVIFSASTLAAKCHGDPKADDFSKRRERVANFWEKIANLSSLLWAKAISQNTIQHGNSTAFCRPFTTFSSLQIAFRFTTQATQEAGMLKLDRIHLINAAGFDEVEVPSVAIARSSA